MIPRTQKKKVRKFCGKGMGVCQYNLRIIIVFTVGLYWLGVVVFPLTKHGFTLYQCTLLSDIKYEMTLTELEFVLIHENTYILR